MHAHHPHHIKWLLAGKIAGGLAVVALAAAILWPRKAKASTGGGGGGAVKRRSPVTARVIEAADPLNPTGPDQYVVQRGDTLDDIAQSFGTTYQELARLNGISDPNQIDVNQVLKIPPASQLN